VLKDGKEIRASKNELSAASEFFSPLFNSEMRENREGIIRLEHITEAVMSYVLEFMHSGSVKLTQDKAKDLLEAADYLLFPRLKTFAGDSYIETCPLLTVFQHIITTRNTNVRTSCFSNSWKFIVSNYPVVAES